MTESPHAAMFSYIIVSAVPFAAPAPGIGYSESSSSPKNIKEN